MENSQPKTVGVVLLLLTFLGLFGAHRFYAGKTGSAIAQLILTITIFGMPITSIWVLIDYFMIIFGEFKTTDGKKFVY